MLSHPWNPQFWNLCFCLSPFCISLCLCSISFFSPHVHCVQMLPVCVGAQTPAAWQYKRTLIHRFLSALARGSVSCGWSCVAYFSLSYPHKGFCIEGLFLKIISCNCWPVAVSCANRSGKWHPPLARDVLSLCWLGSDGQSLVSLCR